MTEFEKQVITDIINSEELTTFWKKKLKGRFTTIYRKAFPITFGFEIEINQDCFIASPRQTVPVVLSLPKDKYTNTILKSFYKKRVNSIGTDGGSFELRYYTMEENIDQLEVAFKQFTIMLKAKAEFVPSLHIHIPCSKIRKSLVFNLTKEELEQVNESIVQDILSVRKTNFITRGVNKNSGDCWMLQTELNSTNCHSCFGCHIASSMRDYYNQADKYELELRTKLKTDPYLFVSSDQGSIMEKYLPKSICINIENEIKDCLHSELKFDKSYFIVNGNIEGKKRFVNYNTDFNTNEYRGLDLPFVSRKETLKKVIMCHMIGRFIFNETKTFDFEFFNHVKQL